MVDIVIVNWNSGGLLKKCVDSILFSDNEPFVSMIFIIDNCSSDSSVAVINIEDKVVLIQNKVNVGFSRACNQGFRLCTSPYVLLLNPDTQLKENTISQSLQFMQSNQEIDILGCQLLNIKGNVSPSCARFPTPLKFLLDATGLPKFFPKIISPAILMTDWNHLESRYVDQVMGAFMFMPIGIFKKLGYFDERFFVYYEELDFSYRLAKLGGKTFYNSTIQTIHIGMGTTDSVKAYRLFLNLQSRLQFAKKHFSVAGFYVVYISTIFIEFTTRLLFLILSGRVNELKDLVYGYKMLMTSKSGADLETGINEWQ